MSNQAKSGAGEVTVPINGTAAVRRAYAGDVPLIVATAVILAAGALYSVPPGGELFDWYQGLLAVLAVAIWALLSGLRRIPHAAERRLWTGIALALAAYLVADALWVFFPDVNHTIPGLLFEELCYLAYYLLILFSIELQPHRVILEDHRKIWRAQRRFEIQGAALFVLGLLISFVVIPIRASAEDYASYAPSGCLYVALDLLILVRTHHAYRSVRRAESPLTEYGHRWRTLYRILLLAELGMLVTDATDLLAYFSLIEEPWKLYGLWYLYPLLFVVAGRLRHVLPSDELREESDQALIPELSRNPFANILLVYALLLPALHLLFQYFELFDFGTNRQRIPVVLVYITAFLVLIGRRQRFEQARIEALEAERRRGEEELRAAMLTAQAANEAKSQFLANMSHEIRTPMNGVIGTADLLLRTAVSDQQREYLETIRTSGDSLLTIINDILDLSKIESGNLSLDWEPFELRAILRTSLSLVAPIAADKGLALSYEVATPVCERLVGDATRTRQVLVNLLNNAIKFTDHGEIRVSLTTHELGDGRHEAHFRVADTGIGIAAEDRDNLFRPFSQVDPSMTRRHGGTGLGLAICRRLCELMDGRIWVDSTSGVGSTFHFTVRGRAAPEEAPVESRDAAGAASTRDTENRTLRILVVDDSEVNQTLTARMLGRLGHESVVVTDGRQALEALERSSYDAVLMDVMMPEMDGLEATRRIRAGATGDEPYIVAMTAHARTEDRQRCLDAGMDDYFVKPFTLDTLEAALEPCLRSSSLEAPAAVPPPATV